MTPGTAAHQAPLSMGFSRQGYWSGLPRASYIGSKYSFLPGMSSLPFQVQLIWGLTQTSALRGSFFLCPLSGLVRSYVFSVFVISLSRLEDVWGQRLCDPLWFLFGTKTRVLFASDLCGTVAGLLGRKTHSLVWVVPAFPHTFVELSHTHQILREGTCLNTAAGQRSFL